eukprot:980195_1
MLCNMKMARLGKVAYILGMATLVSLLITSGVFVILGWNSARMVGKTDGILADIDVTKSKSSTTSGTGKSHGKHTALVVIPMRDNPGETTRNSMLPIIVSVLESKFRRTNQSYHILIVEQANGRLFNRAALFNVGFLWGNEKWKECDYVIAHDIDEIPLHEDMDYGYPSRPIHLLRSRSKDNFRPLYSTNWGGNVAINNKHFKKINGYSNKFWGWGGEDDDFYNRIKSVIRDIAPQPPKHWKTWSLQHKRTEMVGSAYSSNVRVLSESIYPRDCKTDGLTTLKYTVENVEENSLGYTRVRVQFP